MSDFPPLDKDKYKIVFYVMTKVMTWRKSGTKTQDGLSTVVIHKLLSLFKSCSYQLDVLLACMMTKMDAPFPQNFTALYSSNISKNLQYI